MAVTIMSLAPSSSIYDPGSREQFATVVAAYFRNFPCSRKCLTIGGLTQILTKRLFKENPKAGITSNDFSTPNQKLSFDKSQIEIVNLGDVKVFRARLEPGWSWSSCIKESAGTESCAAQHIGVVISGCMVAKHDDGTEVKLCQGDAYVIEAGHDGWVVGDEPVELYEFNTAAVEVLEAIKKS